MSLTIRDFAGHIVIASSVGAPEESRVAERWGLAHAARTGRPVVLAGVFGVGTAVGSAGGLYFPEMLDTGVLMEEARDAAEETLEGRRRELAAEFDGVHIRCAALAGHPGAVLADASASADLVVVGTRGMDGWSGLLFGSVSQYTATHAHGPVAVVPQHLFEELDDDDPIVLGIDGRSDQAATEFAFDQAQRLRRPLVAVHSSRKGDAERDGTDLAEVLDRVLGPVARRHPEVQVDRAVVHEDSDVALLGASARAAMLVVGTRGRGELRSVLFGSTSTRLLGRATCPAVVVPDAPEDRWASSSTRRARAHQVPQEARADDSSPSISPTSSTASTSSSGGATAASMAPAEQEARRTSTDDGAEGSSIEEVLELERATLSPEYRRSPGRVRELLADDFSEVGRSGREFVAADFTDTVDVGPAVSEKVVESMQGRAIAPDVVLVSTTLRTDGRRSRHTSLWRREAGVWRMTHHQGTWADDD